MHNFFQKLHAEDAETKRRVQDAVAQTQFLVGVVATPKFLDAEHHFDYVLGVADRVNGLVFNGTAIMNSDGKTLLRTGE